MKQVVRQIEDHKTLYRDDRTGIAFIEDGTVGLSYSVHPNIDASGSTIGMKKLGYWGKKDRVVRCNGFKYNIDHLVYDENNKYEKIVADECRCDACVERREKEREEKVS